MIRGLEDGWRGGGGSCSSTEQTLSALQLRELPSEIASLGNQSQASSL